MQNDLRSAIDHVRRAIDIRIRTLPPSDPKLIEILVDGAMLHDLAGMDQNASRLFEAARLGAVQRDGENSLLVAAIDIKLGMSLYMQGTPATRGVGHGVVAVVVTW